MDMEKEQLAAGVAMEKIDLTADPACTAADTADLDEQIQDRSAFSPDEQVELANTDKADARNSHIVSDRISTDVDFNSKGMEANYVDKIAPSLFKHTQDIHIGSFYVRQFVAR
ncbi:MAG: hypothetical protein FRX49_06070 [Trebouxia sp. A1-2]|nr:MAG: hypothetical protein FRX49_06070 [Trebouxia sp. A1-2]